MTYIVIDMIVPLMELQTTKMVAYNIFLSDCFINEVAVTSCERDKLEGVFRYFRLSSRFSKDG